MMGVFVVGCVVFIEFLLMLIGEGKGEGGRTEDWRWLAASMMDF